MLYLAGVCRELRELHPAGVRLTICSDGHVFSDLVEVPDEDVTAYGEAIRRMADRLGITDTVETFSLREIYEDLSLPEMRAHLNRHYELPVAAGYIFVVVSVANLYRKIRNAELPVAIQSVKTAGRYVPVWVTVAAWSTFWATGVLFYYK